MAKKPRRSRGVSRSLPQAANAGAPKASPVTTAVALRLPRALVLYVDIPGFSKRVHGGRSYDHERALKCVRHLAEASKALLEESCQETGAKKSHCQFMPTGDGFALLFGDPAFRMKADSVLNFAVKLQLEYKKEASVAGQPDYTLRIGIHEGDVTFPVELPFPNATRTAIGDAMNLGSRVCGIGDRDHIILSDAVYVLLGSDRLQQYRDRCTDWGMVSVRHRERIRVYNYVPRHNNGGPAAGNPGEPSIIRWRRHVQERILRELGEIARHLYSLVDEHAEPRTVDGVTVRQIPQISNEDTDITMERLESDIRVTLLLYEENAEAKAPDERCYLYVPPNVEYFRYMKGVDPGKSWRRPTNVRHAVFQPGEVGRPVGISAVAFAENKPTYISGLPRCDSQRPKPYADALSANGLNVDPEHVIQWQRKARAYIALPLRVDLAFPDEPNTAKPQLWEGGVVAIDTDHPLWEGPDMTAIVGELADTHAAALTYLLRLADTKPL